MAHLPRDIVDAVRERSDIVEVVGRRVRLERRGQSWVGLCPFHQEKSPSFNVIPNKGIYYCFGCQAAGDVFRFLMLTENVSFGEAVRQLAQPAGVTIETRELTDAERRAYAQRRTLLELMEEAATFFEAQLWTGADGEVGRAYLERRGMSVETARKARLGWAPPGWTRLADHLQRKGARVDLLLEGGLVKRRERGDGVYDAFRERLIIPIRDERGRVIAFGGRLLEGDGPKYINSPETELYHKGSVLYGLDAAQNAIRNRGRLILVEGYFDVLSLQQAGFAEAVATCGTALTADHVQKIKALTRTVVVLLDADEAGARAAERTLPMLTNEGIAGLRLQLPDAKDPDELVRERGPAAMDDALRSAVPLLHWVVQRKLKAYGYDAQGKERTLDEVQDLLGDLSPTQISDLAAVLRINEEIVLQRVRRRARAPTPVAATTPDDSYKPHRDVVHLVWLLVHRRGEVADLLSAADPGLLDAHAPVRPLIARLLDGEAPVLILESLADDSLRRLLAAVVARDQLYTADQAALAMIDVLTRLARPRHEARLVALQQTAVEATRRGSAADARDALATRQAAARAWTDLERSVRAGDVARALHVLRPGGALSIDAGA